MSASKRHANGAFGCILVIPPVICMQVVGDGRPHDGDHLLLGASGHADGMARTRVDGQPSGRG